MDLAVGRCMNCGAELTGRWCAACGQDGERRLDGVMGLARRTVREVFDIDGPLRRTVRMMLLEPGALTREYSELRFRSQVAPIRIYLIGSALFFLLAPMLNEALGTVIRMHWPQGRLRLGFLAWTSKAIFALLVPLFAIALRVALTGLRPKPEVLFVFSVHYTGFFTAYLMALAALAALLGLVFPPPVMIAVLMAGLVGPAFYLVAALRVTFGLSPLRRWITGAVLFVAHLLLGQSAATGARLVSELFAG